MYIYIYIYNDVVKSVIEACFYVLVFCFINLTHWNFVLFHLSAFLTFKDSEVIFKI